MSTGRCRLRIERVSSLKAMIAGVDVRLRLRQQLDRGVQDLGSLLELIGQSQLRSNRRAPHRTQVVQPHSVEEGRLPRHKATARDPQVIHVEAANQVVLIANAGSRCLAR